MIFLSYSRDFIKLYCLFAKLEAFQKWLIERMFALLSNQFIGVDSISSSSFRRKRAKTMWKFSQAETHFLIVRAHSSTYFNGNIYARVSNSSTDWDKESLQKRIVILFVACFECEQILTAVCSLEYPQNGQPCKIKQPILKKTLPTSQIPHRI